jgi:TctA family transporter
VLFILLAAFVARKSLDLKFYTQLGPGPGFFPLRLSMLLGPLMERGLRQSLEMSQGDVSILFTRPLSATLLVIALLVIATSTFRALVKF